MAREAHAGVLVVGRLVDVDRVDAERPHARGRASAGRRPRRGRGSRSTTACRSAGPVRCAAARSTPGASRSATGATCSQVISPRAASPVASTTTAGPDEPLERQLVDAQAVAPRSGTARRRGCRTASRCATSSRLKPSRSMVLCTSKRGCGSPGYTTVPASTGTDRSTTAVNLMGNNYCMTVNFWSSVRRASCTGSRPTPRSSHDARQSATDRSPGPRATEVEQHGIDTIPPEHRHSRPARPVPDPVRRREHLRHRHPRDLPDPAGAVAVAGGRRDRGRRRWSARCS